MVIKAVYSTRDSVEDVVRDLGVQLKGFEAKAIIFFASSYFDTSIGQKMGEAFPDTTVFGCSTSGELVSGRMMKGTVVAMALGGDIVTGLKVAVLEGISHNVDVSPAMHSFEAHFGKPVAGMSLDKYVGLVLIDGLRGREEQIMDRIGDKSNITFIGGSAGDDLKFQTTYVYANGRAYTDAAILALLEVKNGFSIIKTQSFRPLDRKLTVTRANDGGREVLEFDGKPAALAYAEAVGTTVLDVPNHFMTNPVGLMVGDEPYVRSPQRLNNKGIIFYCNIPQGMEVTLLQSANIVEDTKKALDAKVKELGHISGILNFHCILRTLELEKKGQQDAYGKVFSDIPTVGFSTYGEEYIGHVNQTSTMLVLL